MLGNDKIESIVIKIKKIYLFLICLYIVLIVIAILAPLNQYDIKNKIESTYKLTYNFIIFLALYIGLPKRKKWIIPLILFFSSLGFLATLIDILHPAESLSRIAEKVIGLLVFLFFGYQIHFFSKAEVKKFFRTKGSILF